jgi:hypothetical protein
MKRAILAACATLLVAASASFAQDRAAEDSQGTKAAPNPAQGTGAQGDATAPTGNSLQNKSALQGGHQGEEGALMTKKECQDLRDREAKDPNVVRTPTQDRECAIVLGATPSKGVAVNGNIQQNRNAVQAGHQGAEGTLMTKKTCQDLVAAEAKNPNLERDPSKDRACARILGTTQ